VLDRLVNLSISHPYVQAWLLGAIALLFLLFRRYRLGFGVAAIAPLWLLLCATPVFAHGLQRWLEGQYAMQPAADYPKADAIVVLGGEALADEKESWRDEGGDAIANSRVGFGYLLFHADRAPAVLLSGAGDARRMAAMLERQGVPPAAVRLESASLTTYENARNCAALLRNDGAHTVLLVTSPAHMPRAAASFEKQGLHVIPAPALPPSVRAPGSGWQPRRAVLFETSHTLHEYIGLWVYRLRGWA